mmetsp:Transcript_7345/g.15030  ORF Transcript_7345/g.15030 Transcript_7345/m.15030 type:complete len:167 (-) Transcript_7345:445-945(-)
MFTFLLSHSQRCSYVMSRPPGNLCRGHFLCLHSHRSRLDHTFDSHFIAAQIYRHESGIFRTAPYIEYPLILRLFYPTRVKAINCLIQLHQSPNPTPHLQPAVRSVDLHNIVAYLKYTRTHYSSDTTAEKSVSCSSKESDSTSSPSTKENLPHGRGSPKGPSQTSNG